jgi:hypothetical protein
MRNPMYVQSLDRLIWITAAKPGFSFIQQQGPNRGMEAI